MKPTAAGYREGQWPRSISANAPSYSANAGRRTPVPASKRIRAQCHVHAGFRSAGQRSGPQHLVVLLRVAGFELPSPVSCIRLLEATLATAVLWPSPIEPAQNRETMVAEDRGTAHVRGRDPGRFVGEATDCGGRLCRFQQAIHDLGGSSRTCNAQKHDYAGGPDRVLLIEPAVTWHWHDSVKPALVFVCVPLALVWRCIGAECCSAMRLLGIGSRGFNCRVGVATLTAWC